MVAYSPTAGIDEVRELWKKLLLEKNPTLDSKFMSLPVVVPGITAGLSYTADLFLNEGGIILAGHPSWDNYKLIFEERRGGIMQEIHFFNSEKSSDNGENGENSPAKGLDMENITRSIRKEAKKGQVRIILNFPNNPSGYSPTKREADMLVDCIIGIAQDGRDVLVISDDAYFGLFYEEDTCKESVFSRLSMAHPRILAVKTDGPTKEDYSWGFRLAMITFGSKGMNSTQFNALITKLMGIIRSSVSCANTPAQNILLKTYADEKTLAEKQSLFELLKRRYIAVKNFINEHPTHPYLSPLPFNSGYFMSLECTIDAEELRLELLQKHGIGTISIGNKFLRLAFSSLEESDIPHVFKTVYDTAQKLGDTKTNQ
jgi:aspartate/methionine/tyrosine aminotransferase